MSKTPAEIAANAPEDLFKFGVEPQSTANPAAIGMEGTMTRRGALALFGGGFGAALLGGGAHAQTNAAGAVPDLPQDASFIATRTGFDGAVTSAGFTQSRTATTPIHEDNTFIRYANGAVLSGGRGGAGTSVNDLALGAVYTSAYGSGETSGIGYSENLRERGVRATTIASWYELSELAGVRSVTPAQVQEAERLLQPRAPGAGEGPIQFEGHTIPLRTAFLVGLNYGTRANFQQAQGAGPAVDFTTTNTALVRQTLETVFDKQNDTSGITPTQQMQAFYVGAIMSEIATQLPSRAQMPNVARAGGG